MNLQQNVQNEIFELLKNEVELTDIIVERPKERSMADYAVPCFSLAKKLHKSPNDIANFIKEKLTNYSKIEVVNGYLNIFIDKNVYAKKILENIIDSKENYGSNSSGKDKTIIVEYSSPNIAKPFGVGHLRSTVIGEALKNICLKNGYNVKSLNYLGDYGTQFGKLIYAYTAWGNKEAYDKDPLTELKRVYVKFHEEASKDPKLDDEGRLWFKKLEDKDPYALELWNKFKNDSLKEFAKTYKLLHIDSFDSYEGEASYIDAMPIIIKELEDKNLLTESEGAMVVHVGDDIIPALIKRSDGASLYMTREIAAVIDRKKKYDFDEALYVVGNEQTLHFNQLKRVIAKMGYPWSDSIYHIGFGMILQNGKKMSTRHGKSFELKDLLNDAIELSYKYLVEKKALVEDLAEASKTIGVGAVIFNDLKNYRTNDIEFNLEDVLKFEGETGPYIQYTYARINSMLKDSNIGEVDYDIEITEPMWNVVFRLYEFNDIILKAKDTYDPSIIAKYIIDVAQDFNKLYATEKFKTEEIKGAFLLETALCTSIVLKEGMRILGIDVLERM